MINSIYRSVVLIFSFLVFVQEVDAQKQVTLSEKYHQLTSIEEKQKQPADSLIFSYQINNTKKAKWLIQTGSWERASIQILKGDSILYSKSVSWERNENSKVYHAYGEDRAMLYDLPLPQGESQLLVVLKNPIFNYFPKNYNIGIGTKEFYEVINEDTLYKTLLVVAILLGFGFYNLILFLFVRDKSFLIYFFVQILFTGISLIGFGYLPFSLKTIVSLDAPVSLLFMGVYSFFAVNYLSIFEKDRFWYRISKVYIIITLTFGFISSCLIIDSSGFISQSLSAYSILIAPNLSLVLVLILIIRRLIKRDQLAYGFSAVMFLFLIMISISYLTNLGFLPKTPLNNYAIGIGMLIESMAYSAVLAYRLNYLKRNLDQSLVTIELAATEKKLMERELDLKESELMSSMVSLAKKQELLTTIKKKIETSDKTVSKRSLLSLINQSFDSQEDWDQFQVKFNALHNGFIDQLKKDFNVLSSTDLKLCVLMKLNLSNKEIAMFLNVQTRSVDQSKYRLKKKMKISEQTDIGDYIRSYSNSE